MFGITLAGRKPGARIFCERCKSPFACPPSTLLMHRLYYLIPFVKLYAGLQTACNTVLKFSFMSTLSSVLFQSTLSYLSLHTCLERTPHQLMLVFFNARFLCAPSKGDFFKKFFFSRQINDIEFFFNSQKYYFKPMKCT